jgi:glycosyltransferase involved in cell wall biosynthesis
MVFVRVSDPINNISYTRSTMKISIIMCFKNEAQHLKKNIDSILAQTEQNFELITVDDHSNDKSIQILKKYSQSDPRVKILTNQGTGIISALKTAYAATTGALITRHDADDLMPPHKLKTLKQLLTKNGPGHVATGLVKYFSDYPLSNGFIKYADWLNHLCKTNNHTNNIFKECVIASPNWMAFREDLDSINAFQDEVYPEDYHLVFKIIEKKLKIVCSDKVTHLWRDHPKRASRTLEQYKDQKFYPLKVSFFIKLHNKKDIILWGAGPSGKKLAKELINQNTPFRWVTNNTNKIGKSIYNIPIEDFCHLKQTNNANVIISVTQRNSLEEIKEFLKKNKTTNYFLF